MKRLSKFSLVSTLVSLCAFNAPSFAGNDARDFIQLVSYENQFASTPRKQATFSEVNGNILQKDDSHITVNQDGTYLVIATVQAGADPKVSSTTTGYLDIWLEVNDQPVNFTVARSTIRPNETVVIPTQAVMLLKKGDTIGLKFSSNNPKIGFVSFTQATSSPPISSANLSIFKI
jgi:hypothetical protein